MTNSNRTDEEKLLGCTAALIALLFVIPLAAWEGWAFSVLWRWFIVPATQWNPIGVWHAAGIIATITIISYTTPSDSDKDPVERLFGKISEGILVPLASLGLGWLFHLWMMG